MGSDLPELTGICPPISLLAIGRGIILCFRVGIRPYLTGRAKSRPLAEGKMGGEVAERVPITDVIGTGGRVERPAFIYTEHPGTASFRLNNTVTMPLRQVTK